LMELKLLASRIGFPKLHLDTARLEVHFPPQTDTVFYEGENFQHIMTAISKKRDEGVRVLQTETLLKALVPFREAHDTASAVSRSRAFLEDLAGVVAEIPSISPPSV